MLGLQLTLGLQLHPVTPGPGPGAVPALQMASAWVPTPPSGAVLLASWRPRSQLGTGQPACPCLPRAAAYSKLGNYTGAVQDCERAICIDPTYSKAYGRMG